MAGRTPMPLPAVTAGAMVPAAMPAPVALVTGAAQRIGRALALDLAAHGHAVAVHYHRSAEAAASLVAKIEAGGGRALALAADLAQESEVARLVPTAAKLGPVTLLVNNASLFERDEALTVTRASWDAHLEVNLRAPFLLSQQLACQLPAGVEGNIVNLLDQRVWNLTPHFTSYTLSKAGLWTLTQTLALALAPQVRVNAIGPGPALASTRQTDEQFRRQQESTPLRRGTTPAEICAALRFILASAAMTGQMVALDGGQHLGWRQGPLGSEPQE
jgi:NAD(P)-dependent dehydrogenase (short-subunit alcohol dehydrogenase family)